MFPQFGVYLAGANTFGFLVAAFLCLRALKRTEDILFVGLAAAFVLFAVNQFVAAAEMGSGSAAFGHLLRLAGFAISIAAIVSGNLLTRATRP
jgi:hypothetical protein